MGCGCDMGCECQNKSVMGQIEQATGMNPWWFLAGAGVGLGLWYVVSKPPASAMPSSAGQESIMPVPKAVPPPRYANLQAVSDRLQQISQLYPATISPQDALAQSEDLKTAANQFSLQEGERVSEVIAAIDDFQDRVKDFIQFQQQNPSIPQYVQPGSVPVTNMGPGFVARA
jgi:hypothetical protein